MLTLIVNGHKPTCSILGLFSEARALVVKSVELEGGALNACHLLNVALDLFQLIQSTSGKRQTEHATVIAIS